MCAERGGNIEIRKSLRSIHHYRRGLGAHEQGHVAHGRSLGAHLGAPGPYSRHLGAHGRLFALIRAHGRRLGAHRRRFGADG